MCATCGCSADAVIRWPGGHDHGDHGTGSGHDHPVAGHRHAADGTHDHGAHGDGHQHVAADDDGRTVELQQKVLAKNDSLAAANRDWLARRGVLALNLMSSPGAGKTTLLERAGEDLAGALAVCVIEGDQETALDAGRIESAGCRVVQVNTGAGCHLDAAMVSSALRVLDPPGGSVAVIENVGNLVCPALFDLGEAARVVLASVTEGADKPVKYPHVFRSADLVLLTKTDLLPYVDFDVAAWEADVGRVSPGARIIRVSAKTGEGMAEWYAWLRGQLSVLSAPSADPERVRNLR